VDTNWCTDAGANEHVTGDLEKLSIRGKYRGNDQIRIANGVGMEINHIGRTIIPTSACNLHLNKILHVPKAKKNLVSVHRLAKDNSVFLEFHPTYFMIKDQVAKNTILKGRCRNGLYPLPSAPPIKQAFGVVKPSLEQWHSCLGHPSSPIVSRVISSNNLPCLLESSKELVCDACQKAKSHKLPYYQLPYSRSSSISSFPLEPFILMFGVLHPILLEEETIMSVLLIITASLLGFIFSNLNLNCFKNFMSSKILLKGYFIKKSSLCRSTGEGNIRGFLPFFIKLACPIEYLVLMLISRMVLLKQKSSHR
jgi:hypothetical protein